MEPRRAGVVIVGLAVAVAVSLVAGVGTVPADEQYQLSVAGSIDVPERNVTFDGDSYTVSAVGRADPGTTVSVTASGPENTSYAVYLYNNDEQVVDTRQVTGDGSVSFDTGELGLDPGTYILTINGPDGNTRAVHPLVVRGYAVDLTAPADADPGETVTFQVDISEVDPAAPDVRRVEVVIAQGDSDRTLTATETSDGTYTVNATLNTSGTYRVYAVVRGDDTVGDEQELLGLSDGGEVSVSSETTTTPDTTTPSDGGGDRTQPTTTQPAQSTTTDPTTTRTRTRSPPPTDVHTATSEMNTSSQMTAETTTTVTTDAEVVTPATTTRQPTTTTGALDGLRLVAIGILVLAGTLQLARRTGRSR